MVSSALSIVLSSKNWTPITLTSSVALALMVMMSAIVALFDGVVSVIVGGVVSLGVPDINGCG